MKNLDEFLRLSHYLKSYELYKSFSEMDERNKRAISKIEDNLEEQDHLAPEEERELKQYRNILEKVDFNNKLLENSFNNYDFNEETVNQALTDYTLYAYEFITHTIKDSMAGKKFLKEKDVLNHVYAAEKIIRRHLIAKFYIHPDLDTVFEKSIQSVLEKKLSWNKTTEQYELKHS